MDFIIFILVLSVLIVVHEFGHFLIAKKLGVNVERFSVGFGKKLYSRTVDGTEFMISAVPLGGYVKMAGDERSECKGNKDEFFSQAPGKRALIAVMGPVVNYIFAYICLSCVFMLGYVDLGESRKNVDAVVGGLQKESPAMAAGLEIGDTVTQIGETPIENWADLQDTISASTGEALTVYLQRDGQTLMKTMTPRIDVEKNIFGREEKIPRIGVIARGIESNDDVVITKYGFFESLSKGFEELMEVTSKTYQALFEMVSGRRSPKEMMGIVGMFYVIKFAASVSFSLFLHMVGIVSASLAIFNLLPLIPLDGGHIMLTLIEKIRGKTLSVKVEDLISRVGYGLILTLALFVFYVDFERVGLIDKILTLWR